MKYFLLFFLTAFIDMLYAMPCPNSGGIIYKGDSIDEVLKQCGPPHERHTTIKQSYTQKKFIYYRPHPYDQGSSQIIIIFTNDKVSNIHIFERYTYYMCRQQAVQAGVYTTIQTTCGDWDFYTPNTNLCGRIIGINDSLEHVQSICGQPATKEDLPADKVELTEFRYGEGISQTIIFQNGKLIDWK